LEFKKILKYNKILDYYHKNEKFYDSSSYLEIDNKPNVEILDIFRVDEFLTLKKEKYYLFSCFRNDLQKLYEELLYVELKRYKFYLKYQKDKEFKKKIIKAKKISFKLVL